MKILTQAVLLGGLLLSALQAQAGRPVMAEHQMLASYRQECASCHMAYPPDFLSKTAWRRVMGSLSKHYGVDASLDAQTVAEITQWLDRTSGTYKRTVESSAGDRLTTTEWFLRKHREISSSVFQRASIQSPSRCVACHVSADRGIFSDDLVRIPK
jgi:nitrate/TMAO reductase-like tetraheme cytochrome c subunit